MFYKLTLTLLLTLFPFVLSAKALLIVDGTVSIETHKIFLNEVKSRFEDEMEVLESGVLKEMHYFNVGRRIDASYVLSDAVDDYFDLKIEESLKKLENVISDVCVPPLINGSVCFKALIYDALIGRQNSSIQTTVKKLRRAIDVAPNANLSDFLFPESFVFLYKKIKNENYNYVDVSINTKYSNSKIYLNGIYYGIAPLKTRIPHGRYYLVLKVGVDKYSLFVDIDKNGKKLFLDKNKMEKYEDGDFEYKFLSAMGIKEVINFNTQSNIIRIKCVSAENYIDVANFELKNIKTALDKIERILIEDKTNSNLIVSVR